MIKIQSYGKSGILLSLIVAYQPYIFSMEEKKRKFEHDDEKVENPPNVLRAMFNEARKTLELRCLESLKDESLRDQIMQEGNGKGDTLLHTFAYLGELEKVKYLAENGADMKKENNNGEKPIISAAQGGHIDVVKFLFKNNGYDDMFDAKKLLTFLVKSTDERAVAFFKKQFSHVIMPKLIVHTVRGGGHLDFLEYFLEQQQNPSIPGIAQMRETIPQKQKNKSILVAAKNGHPNHLKKLIEFFTRAIKEFDVLSFSTNSRGFSPLWLAAYNGHIPCIDVLMKAGLPLNRHKRNEDRVPKIDLPLHGALLNCQHATVKFLVEHGADVNAEDVNDVSPLIYTAVTGDLEMLQFLLSKGASTKGQEFILLFESLRNRNFEFGKFLLENKISTVNVESDRPLKGESILGCAARTNLQGAVEFLLGHGADVHHPSVILYNDYPNEAVVGSVFIEDTKPGIVDLIENARRS